MTDIDALVARLSGFQQGYAESVADADGTLALMHKAAAALRELEKDAKRYRWLRDCDQSHWNYLKALTPVALDEAIDAANSPPRAKYSPNGA